METRKIIFNFFFTLSFTCSQKPSHSYVQLVWVCLCLPREKKWSTGDVGFGFGSPSWSVPTRLEGLAPGAWHCRWRLKCGLSFFSLAFSLTHGLVISLPVIEIRAGFISTWNLRSRGRIICLARLKHHFLKRQSENLINESKRKWCSLSTRKPKTN